MNDTPALRKKLLRSRLRDRLAAVSAASHAQLSSQACALLEQQEVWKRARTVFMFSPSKSELDISPLIQSGMRDGKTLLFPRFDPETGGYVPGCVRDVMRDWIEGKFGIREPAPHCEAYSLKQLDLTLVPGLGFDPFGQRLGRGRGFYDRLLAEVSGVKCGVAFDEQIVEEVPVEPHDVPVDYLLTPTRWIVVARQKT